MGRVFVSALSATSSFMLTAIGSFDERIASVIFPVATRALVITWGLLVLFELCSHALFKMWSLSLMGRFDMLKPS